MRLYQILLLALRRRQRVARERPWAASNFRGNLALFANKWGTFYAQFLSRVKNSTSQLPNPFNKLKELYLFWRSGRMASSPSALEYSLRVWNSRNHMRFMHHLNTYVFRRNFDRLYPMIFFNRRKRMKQRRRKKKIRFRWPIWLEPERVLFRTWFTRLVKIGLVYFVFLSSYFPITVQQMLDPVTLQPEYPEYATHQYGQVWVLRDPPLTPIPRHAYMTPGGAAAYLPPHVIEQRRKKTEDERYRMEESFLDLPEAPPLPEMSPAAKEQAKKVYGSEELVRAANELPLLPFQQGETDNYSTLGPDPPGTPQASPRPRIEKRNPENPFVKEATAPIAPHIYETPSEMMQEGPLGYKWRHPDDIMPPNYSDIGEHERFDRYRREQFFYWENKKREQQALQNEEEVEGQQPTPEGIDALTRHISRKRRGISRYFDLEYWASDEPELEQEDPYEPYLTRVFVDGKEMQPEDFEEEDGRLRPFPPGIEYPAPPPPPPAPNWPEKWNGIKKW